jgi:hypothetical protein
VTRPNGRVRTNGKRQASFNGVSDLRLVHHRILTTHGIPVCSIHCRIAAFLVSISAFSRSRCSTCLNGKFDWALTWPSGRPLPRVDESVGIRQDPFRVSPRTKPVDKWPGKHTWQSSRIYEGVNDFDFRVDDSEDRGALTHCRRELTEQGWLDLLPSSFLRKASRLPA